MAKNNRGGNAGIGKRGKPFEPGNPGGPGRPAGVPNKVTQETREIVARLMDEDYFNELQARIKARELHPTVEKFLLEHRLGKPKETIDLVGNLSVSATYDLSKASVDELRLLERLLDRLERANATEAQ